MSLAVSKDCFPTPTKCHKCERKMTDLFKKEAGPKDDYKRCANCHLMTYCDKDCQKEHWIKVHKSHCRFLSGKTPIKNSIHTTATCARCIEERETGTTLRDSENSPKTNCNIQLVVVLMKSALSNDFGFHGQGKNCNCSLQNALNLPFALGEVSGQYLQIASTGLDAWLAHALKITNAIGLKAKDRLKAKNCELRNALRELMRCIIEERACLWYDILVSGNPRGQSSKRLPEQIDHLKTIYGASNPWWKTLTFAVTFIINTQKSIRSNFRDFNNLDDPRFQKLKELQDYNQSQLQNQATVCEKKMWPKFMLWPQLVNGSLVVLLPPGTHSQSCNNQLSGQMAVTAQESNSKFLPCLFSLVGDDGTIVAHCSHAQKPTCGLDYIRKNVEERMMLDEEVWKQYKKEDDLFLIEARDCVFCLKMSLSSHRCSSCLTVQYCSTTCQKEDLNFHRTVCATWAKDEARTLLGKGKQKNYWKKIMGGEK